MKTRINQVTEWARTRGILCQSTAQFQMLKGCEEHGEMAGAVLRGDREELIDSVGDQLVVAIIQCVQLGYDEVYEWAEVPEYTFSVEIGQTGEIERMKAALYVTVQTGCASGSIARSRCARGDFDNLFDALYRVCYLNAINPLEALDSVYEIISKRGGEMRNGVWVKEADL